MLCILKIVLETLPLCKMHNFRKCWSRIAFKLCEQDHSRLEPAAWRSVRNSPLQTKYLEKRG